MKSLARNGFAVEVLCGSVLGIDLDIDLAAWFTDRGWDFTPGSHVSGQQSLGQASPTHLRMCVDEIPITVQFGPRTAPHEAAEAERGEFLELLKLALDRFRPDVIVVSGTDRFTTEVLESARHYQVATVLLHDFRQRDSALLSRVDRVLAPSQFAADFHRTVFGHLCAVLPPFADRGMTGGGQEGSPGYLTFIDPTPERGAYIFAGIAEELKHRRPDIPILVVEGRGTSSTLEYCGLDVQAQANITVTDYATDPRLYWSLTRVCLLPWLSWEEYPLAAFEALQHGVPVIASDRGALPEILGEGAVVLPLPGRLTPVTSAWPTPEDVAPWVEAIINVWDDPNLAQQLVARALAAGGQHAREIIEPEYLRFFNALQRDFPTHAASPSARSKSVVLVPHHNGIDPECEESLQRLKNGGLKVVRRAGCSAIDLARNELISAALLDGYESMLFIDSDIGFDPCDAYRLLARPEPVVAGVYAMKGQRALAGHFAEGSDRILFGPDVAGPYPLKYAAAGFLRIKAWVLRRMIDELELPLCNTKWGRGLWPFFLPMVVQYPDGQGHYISEDFAFSHRLGQIGVTPVCDTTIRLWHWGRFGYSWEEAAMEPVRHRSFLFLNNEPD